MIVSEIFSLFGFKIDESSVNQVNKTIEKIKVAAVGLFDILAAKKLFDLASGTAELGHELELTSQRLGIGTEELQKFQYAAKLSGVEANVFNLLLVRLAKSTSASAQEGKKFSEGLGLIHLNASDINKLPLDQKLLKISDAFSKMKDGQDKVNASLALFGRTGSTAIPFLDLGSQKILELGEQLKAFGGILDEDAIKSGAEFRKGLIQLGALFDGLKNIIGSRLIKVFDVWLKQFTQYLILNKDIIKENLNKFLDTMVTILQDLAVVAMALWHAFTFLADVLGGVHRAAALVVTAFIVWQGLQILSGIGHLIIGFRSLIAALYGVAEAAGIADAAIGFWPILIAAAIAVIIGLFYLMYNDIKAFFEGRNSIAGLFVLAAEHVGAFVSKSKLYLQVLWITIKEIFAKITGHSKMTWTQVWADVKSSFGRIFGLFEDVNSFLMHPLKFVRGLINEEKDSPSSQKGEGNIERSFIGQTRLGRPEYSLNGTGTTKNVRQNNDFKYQPNFTFNIDGAQDPQKIKDTVIDHITDHFDGVKRDLQRTFTPAEIAGGNH